MNLLQLQLQVAMNPKTKNLLIRTLSGAVFVALMIAATFFPVAMVVLMMTVAIIGIREFSELTSGPEDQLSQFLLILSTMVLFLMMPFQMVEMSSWTSAIGPFFTFLLVFPIVMIAYTGIMATAELFRKRPCPIEQIGKGIFGMIWIVLPLGMMVAMTFASPKVVLAFMLLIWGNDTFAYLGGSLYGKHKLFVRVSPKKTWEGTLTGAFMTIVLAVILHKIPFFTAQSCLTDMSEWIFFAILTVLFGTVGDLLESLFKRNAGVKDSGNILPGHGGILDRFDSMLFSAVPVFLFVFALYLSGF